MEFMFDNAANKLLKGELNLQTATLKLLLLKGTAPLKTITNLTGINEYDGAGYTRKTLTTVTITGGELSADNVFWNSINGANQITGIIVFEQKTDDADSVPIVYTDNGFPVLLTNTRYELDLDKLIKLAGSVVKETVNILIDANKTNETKVNELKTLYGVA